jgi:Domain of unknown function (DUF1996)
MKVHTANLPPVIAKDFLRAELHFPDCWDGRHLDSEDHKSHVTFRGGDGTCPPTHPVPVPEIDVEFGFETKEYGAQQLVLSTGDTTGYSKFLIFC